MMPTSQPLMALMSMDIPSADWTDRAAKSQYVEGDDDFAQLLREHMPDELQTVIEQLTPEQLALLEQAALAADGKTLPPMHSLTADLPPDTEAGSDEPLTEDPLGAIAQWLTWLQAAPVASDSPATAAVASAIQPATTPFGFVSNHLSGVPEVDPEVDIDINLREGSRNTPHSREIVSNDLLSAPESARAARANTPGQEFTAALQRAAGAVSEEPMVSTAMLGKLVEQLERAGRQLESDEGDGLDALNKPTLPGSANVALTARPVAAAAPAMGVPFGQSGWNAAVVEKVMWMSSQNLRSVEIRLDPAELGPMEIHIQNRGQELQVQFVSQHPAVREALEAQMHRLREMFSQQGLEQTEVTVADRSPSDQQEQQQRDEQLAQQGLPGGRGSSAGTDTDASNLTSPGHQLEPRWVTQRLIDFYA